MHVMKNLAIIGGLAYLVVCGGVPSVSTKGNSETDEGQKGPGCRFYVRLIAQCGTER
ncbi:MAG: hypothetical protein LZF60_270023 [Nitrospira sp.]|nr:MAG: hypothetical protein LZF60_270023 [Nitrospira sp.]